jgi:hypothetical protein
VVTIMPQPLGKGPLVPTVQETGWTPELVWMQRVEEKFITSVRDQMLKSYNIMSELPSSPNNIVCQSIIQKVNARYSIYLCPERNSFIIASLSFCGISPCIELTVKLASLIFSVNQST